MRHSRKVRLSDPAKADLARIAAATQRRWGRAQKTKYLQKIKDRWAFLRQSPGIGTEREDIDQGLRAHPAEHHVIFNRETDDAVVVVRFLRENMDPDRHLPSYR